MTRAKRGYVARRYRKGIAKLASGFRGAHSRIARASNQQMVRALDSSRRDRYKRKGDFRRLWITRINAAARRAGVSYAELIRRLSDNQVLLNRKILSQIAVLSTAGSFTTLLGGSEER
uniref:Large ribosomal subunit protein bL20c n=1 Tax=Selaginella remotifolia TaxID=137170 RepID=A0A482CKC6_SELRE|nr:ribosomal protein L20 [Selaginella remotifolia]QBL76277.1 ribosomal protein L20 [Selaginella remotifolia]